MPLHHGKNAPIVGTDWVYDNDKTSENNDFENSIKYYIKAADNNIVSAMIFLGYHYYSEQNYDEMKKYYWKIGNMEQYSKCFEILEIKNLNNQVSLIFF